MRIKERIQEMLTEEVEVTAVRLQDGSELVIPFDAPESFFTEAFPVIAKAKARRQKPFGSWDIVEGSIEMVEGEE